MNARNRTGRGYGFALAATFVAALGLVAAAWGGGTPENLLLVIDPSSTESLYVGNYYKSARDVPDANVIYMEPGAVNYPDFADVNLDALFGQLANTGIEEHIDYVVVMPGASFYISAPNLISDGCAPVTRFAASSVYTMAFIADEVLGQNLASTTVNRYYRGTNEARAFDSSVAWYAGSPSSLPQARRYFIGAMLGYSGQRGNTLAETITMIDRSVAVDGTRPAGTFYFMETTDPLRSEPRDPYFPSAVAAIRSLGGQAEHLMAVLPTGRHDCLGIMTGWAGPDIDGADMTILPGAFCDHLTSYAGKFDTSSQTKMSRWIVKGAAGSWGAVEEPCNYPGKFPHARMHVFYYQGLSLGEAAMRSAAYVPFQSLLYGDPMTRPFAHLPTVAVPDAPTGPVVGVILLTPTATTTHPTAQIAQLDLLIDGVMHDSIAPGGQFVLNTYTLTDGWHELRVLAYDDTLVRSVGRWVGPLTVDNHGQSITLAAAPLTGDWSTRFELDVSTVGVAAREVRVVQNGRVVAAAPGNSALLTVCGLTLGSGPVRLRAEARLADGRTLGSTPVALDVGYAAGTPSGQPPTAFAYTKSVFKDQPFLVELPATFDDEGVPLTFEITSGPAQVTIASGQTGPYRLMRPLPGAKGQDSFRFRVNSSAGVSNEVTVNLELGILRGDTNCDGAVDFGDINPFVLMLSDLPSWQAAHPDCPAENGDINADGLVDFGDINPFVTLLVGS